MSVWKTKLSETYSTVRKEFHQGNFDRVIEQGNDMISEYIMLSSGVSYLDLKTHTIPSDIPILPTIALILRAKYELGEGEQAVAYIMQIFGTYDNIPFDVFLLLIDILSASNLPADVIRNITDYINANLYILVLTQYQHLLELILEKGFFPLKQYEDALFFIANDRRLSTELGIRTLLLERIEDMAEKYPVETTKQIHESMDLKTSEPLKPSSPPRMSRLKKLSQQLLQLVQFSHIQNTPNFSKRPILNTLYKIVQYLRIGLFLYIFYTLTPYIRQVAQKFISLPGINRVVQEFVRAFQFAFTFGFGTRL